MRRGLLPRSARSCSTRYWPLPAQRLARSQNEHPAMFGKLSLAAIPWDQPIPLITSAVIIVLLAAILGLVTYKGWWPYLWREWLTSTDHKRIGVMYVVLALVMLIRGFSDAIMMRSQLALAAGSAAGFLPPEHYDQIFSAHGTIMIFFVAMAFVIGLMNFVVPLQLVELLASPRRSAARQHVTDGRRVCAHGLACLSAALRAAILSRGGRGLLSVELANLRTRDAAVRNQSHHHDIEAARARHELWSDAHLLLDRSGLEPVDRRGLSDPHGDLCDAAARPVPGVPLLYHGRRRQRHDVHQSDLGLGSSRGLHPDPACVRYLLRSNRHLFGQGSVRAPVHGDRHHGDLPPVLHRVAPPFLHHGGGGQRQCILLNHDHDHLRAYRREGFQLAVHAVWRAGAFHRPDLLVARVHGHLRNRRDDRGAHGHTVGRFRAAQQPVSGRSLPQCGNRRRPVRGDGWIHLLFSEGLRLHAG